MFCSTKEAINWQKCSVEARADEFTSRESLKHSVMIFLKVNAMTKSHFLWVLQTEHLLLVWDLLLIYLLDLQPTVFPILKAQIETYSHLCAMFQHSSWFLWTSWLLLDGWVTLFIHLLPRKRGIVCQFERTSQKIIKLDYLLLY